jgi:hypothetical protein
MKVTINPLDPISIAKAQKRIMEYQKWIERKERELLDRLAMYGATRVSLGFARAIYDEQGHDIKMSVEMNGNVAKIIAQGEDVCFVEFGAGIRYGEGYPSTSPSGKGSGRPRGVVGIGEYGKGKGKNPKGWWYTGDDGDGHHTYGNPPSMTMWKTSVELREIISDIAREVFKS